MADEIVSAVLPKIAGASGITLPLDQVPVEQLTTSSSSAYRHYVLGMLWVSQHRVADAQAEFELAISEDEGFALAYFQLARTYFGGVTVAPNIAKARRYTAEAWKCVDRLGTKEKLLLGAFQHGLDYEITLEMESLRGFVERWPDDKELLGFFESQAFWWWYFEDIVEIAGRARKIYPDDHHLQGATLTQALINLGREEQARRNAEAYLEKEPDDPNGWDVLGLSYLALGHPDSAEAAYRKAVELDPDWGGIVFADCAYHEGKLEMAIAKAESLIIESDPAEEDLIAYVMYAYTHHMGLPALYREAGRYSDAVRVMEDSRKYVEDDPTFWQYQAGRLYSCVGMADRALEIAGEMEKSDEIRARVFAMRFKGLAHVAAGDLDKAAASAVMTHRLAETAGLFISYPAHKLDAAIALAENDGPAALKAIGMMADIQKSLVNGMIDVDYRDMLADAYQVDGVIDRAIETHLETLRILGGHAISHYKLGLLYEQVGEPGKAAAHYERFLEMWRDADEGLPQPQHARERLEALKGRI
ncbi:MAG TPA: tetratricopeptide repeat protein [Candidatus Eisenbacteria bacterium]|uniref:Tetratricopeptide repeat protein n=1 Tax=Eiseniibacteriota bacterium TaxID=2212470 RepID=A0A7V2F2J3_UNCEI|nr:tetratricopeptide repeat protein [Candidatus Eisenbacteria bacterium]